MRYIAWMTALIVIFAPVRSYPISWSNFSLGDRQSESAENSAQYFRAIASISEALALIEEQSIGQARETLTQATDGLRSVVTGLQGFADLDDLEDYTLQYGSIANSDVNALKFYFDNFGVALNLDEGRIWEQGAPLPLFANDLIRALSQGVEHLIKVIEDLNDSEKFEATEDIEPLILTNLRLTRFGLIVAKLLP